MCDLSIFFLNTKHNKSSLKKKKKREKKPTECIITWFHLRTLSSRYCDWHWKLACNHPQIRRLCNRCWTVWQGSVIVVCAHHLAQRQDTCSSERFLDEALWHTAHCQAHVLNVGAAGTDPARTNDLKQRHGCWMINISCHVTTSNLCMQLSMLSICYELNSPLCLCSLKVRLLQLPPMWLMSIHSGQASKSTKFCSKISNKIPQVWSCTASFAQPTLVTSPLKDWLQDFNPVLQHFHQLFSRLYRSASIRLHPFLGHAPCIFLSSKLSHLVQEHSPSKAQLNGIYCLMDSDTLNLLLHSKQLSKPISSDLHTNLLYLLDDVCVCMFVFVFVCGWMGGG